MKKIFSILLFCCTFLVAAFAQTVAEFNFDDTSGATTTTETISKNIFDIKNNFNRPERIKGVKGNALRLDGWSTYAQNDNFNIPATTKQFSLEVWYTTEAFTAENASIIQQEDGDKGFSLQLNSSGNPLLSFWADGLSKVVFSQTPIEKYKWNYIVANVDLTEGIAKIFINGAETASYNFGTVATPFSFAKTTMYLGRRSIIKTFSGFSLNTLNGAMDELKINTAILTAQQITNNYEKYKNIIPDLNIDPTIRHANDRIRPQFHAMPNTAWTNEPYGLIYFKGKYHLFFQKNPNGPYLYFMHWGHLTSTDLVNWQEEKIPLSPSAGFDSFGVWSGTTIKDDTGKPVIIYTGVNGAKAGIGVAFATSDTLDDWKKYAGNPVIAAPPSAYKHMDFRDPYVWKEGNVYYMIVGSGLQNNGGGILFTYKSFDLKTWLSVSPIFQNTNTTQSGIFWEMPFFYKITDKDYVLQITPIPNNGVKAKSIYWVGKFENDKFTPYFSEPKPIEYINEKLLAPAIGKDENDQTTYIGIIPEDRDVNDQIKAGWRQTFSLPRLVRLLKDSTLGQVPHPNLCRLRSNPITINNRKIQTGTSFNLPEIKGNQTEIQFKIKAESNTKFLIQVGKNADLTEFTSLGFDLKKNEISLDRQFSTLSPSAKSKETIPYFFNPKENILVDIFIDHSILEVFIDNVVVFSCRIYPSKATSENVDLVVPEGAAEIISLQAWQMKAMTKVNSVEVCKIDDKDLPQKIRTQKDILAVEEKKNEVANFEIFPNVTNDVFNIVYKGENALQNANFTIYNQEGKLFLTQQLTEQTSININHFPGGIYFILIKNNGFYEQFCIVKI